MIIDECFPYNQLIVTEIGKVEIGILYTLWKSNKTVPFVLSYNEKSRVFEYKKITFGWERQNDELLESGQKNEYNQNLTVNPETSGRYHSDWLSMMYPRLKLARNLLSEKGLIFISPFFNTYL